MTSPAPSLSAQIHNLILSHSIDYTNNYLTFPNDDHKYRYNPNKSISNTLKNKLSTYLYNMPPKSSISKRPDVEFKLTKSFDDRQTQTILNMPSIKQLDNKTKIHTTYAGKFRIPTIIRQFKNIYKEIPEIVEKVSNYDDEFKRGLKGVRISLINNETGEPRNLTIPPHIAKKEDLIIDYIKNIDKEVEGSDKIETNAWELINSITLLYYKPIAGGKPENVLLPIIDNNESKTNNCIQQAMIKCGYTDYPNNQSIYELLDYLKRNNISDIAVYNNTILLTENYEMNENYELVKIKNKKRNYAIHNIIEHDFNIEYLYYKKEPKYNLLWDGNHISICEPFDNIKNLFYYCDGEIYLNVNDDYKCLTDKKGYELKRYKPKNKDLIFIYFDYETIIELLNPQHPFKPYSVSYITLLPEELEQINNDDENENVEKWIKKAKHLFGFDCNKLFMEEINELTKKYKVVLIGFNNSNFDNFFITNGFLENNINDVKIFYANNSILDFEINNNISSFDLARHLIGTLNSNCKGFKIKCLSKQSIDHQYAQELYDNGELFTNEEFKKKLEKYNNYDVLCLPILHYKYQQAIYTITEKNPITLITPEKKILTIGGLSYKLFQINAEKLKINIPKFNKEQMKYYDDILKYSSAGRCDLYKENGKKPDAINEKIASVDVCSEYPYVMAIGRYYYPTGKIITVNKFIKEKLGYYWVNIDQTKLKQKIQCEKIFNNQGISTNNKWDSDIINNVFINSERIKYLKKNGCIITNINGGNIDEECEGFCFKDKIKGCELFKPILEIMKLKMTEDRYKANKDDRYNPALRETAKLLSNSLSGKVIEKLHLDKYELVEHTDIRLFNDGNDDITVCQIYDNKALINYKADKEKEFVKHRPVFYGNLIYTYAQQYLYEHTILNGNSFYFDTDSAKMLYTDFEKWEKEYAGNELIDHWEEVEEYEPLYKTHKLFEKKSKLYGSFEDELKDLKQKVSYFDDKKQYAIITEQPEYSKITFKGINITYDGETKKIIANDPVINPNNKIDDLYKYYNNNKHILNDWEQVFKDLNENKPVCFLTGSFSRIIKKGNGNEINYNNRIKIIGGSEEQRKNIKKQSPLFTI